MIKPRLCVDIDNCLSKTDRVMRGIIGEATGGRVNLEYEHVVEFKYQRCPDALGEKIDDREWEAVHDRFSDADVIRGLEPLEGVPDCLARLTPFFSLHLATSRLRKARIATIEWLESNRFPEHDLHFLKHGEKHAALSHFFAAVEDDYDQAVAFAFTQTPCFLVTHPWNREGEGVGRPPKKGVTWVGGWQELTDRLVRYGQCLQGS